MSHRTEDLKPLSGLARLVRDQRYNEPARQGLAVILIALYTWTAAPASPWVWIGLALALIGMLVRLYASGYIMKNTELATTGPYALVRHPLYTGNILLIIGFSIANLHWWTYLLSALFFWFYYPTAIEYEDRKLRRLFGSAWEDWARHTPALVPDLRNAAGVAAGQWSFAKSTAKNGEVVIAIFILMCAGIIAYPLLDA